MKNRFVNVNKKFAFIYSLVFFGLSFVVTNSFRDGDLTTNYLLTSFTFFSYLYCIFFWVWSGNKLISLFTFFILYSLLSNLGQPMLHLLGVPSYSLQLFRSFDFAEINDMLRFQLLCVSSLTLGASIYVSNKKNFVSSQRISKQIKDNRKDHNTSSLDTFWNVVMYFSFAYMIVYAIIQISLRQNISYDELYFNRDPMSQYPYFFSVVLGIRSIYIRRNTNLIYIFWSLMIIMLFLIGTRSPAIVYVSALIVTFTFTHQRLFRMRYIFVWGAVFVFAFGLISFISEFRTTSLDFTDLNILSLDIGESVINTVIEMGGSARTIIYTMRWVNSGGEKYQTLIYTLFHGFTPTGVLALIDRGWSTQLGVWINEYALAFGTQYGYSFIAEAYMNYGNLGWIFMIVYGFFIAFIEITAYKSIIRGNYLLSAILFSILGKQVFFARAQIGLVLSFYRISFYIFLAWTLVTLFQTKFKVQRIWHNTIDESMEGNR